MYVHADIIKSEEHDIRGKARNKKYDSGLVVVVQYEATAFIGHFAFLLVVLQQGTLVSL